VFSDLYAKKTELNCSLLLLCVGRFGEVSEVPAPPTCVTEVSKASVSEHILEVQQANMEGGGVGNV
jgi:hypothetical protein